MSPAKPQGPPKPRPRFFWVVCPDYFLGPYGDLDRAESVRDGIVRFGACTLDHEVIETRGETIGTKTLARYGTVSRLASEPSEREYSELPRPSLRRPRSE